MNYKRNATRSLDDSIVFLSSKRKVKETSDSSECSSEVLHEKVTKSFRLLTRDEFEKLPAKGSISPVRLRTAQGGINKEFRDDSKGSVEDLAKKLSSNPDYADKVPRIQLGIYKGRVWSFNTRRVVAGWLAWGENNKVELRYEKLSSHEVEKALHIKDKRPFAGLVTAMRMGGKRSETMAIINPVYKDQLSENVFKVFKPYPSERNYDLVDENGFPKSFERKLDKAKKRFDMLAKRVEDLKVRDHLSDSKKEELAALKEVGKHVAKTYEKFKADIKSTDTTLDKRIILKVGIDAFEDTLRKYDLWKIED